ncbi:putative geranylgeranyl transferase beta subunit [Talaromyces proteolyticus]|uniref:Geranylgeranyl transferase beta subunit n=1 Tax=Talaromyces proteolyticus TaxID=1131652 RepID=A0AAD4PXF1_9EURO|nr:putative geranylgeranyl transferase beta subunit [Talaromyces proteolyticus]KAH8693595.1 putative geranylgeranyl transferase beta subunit [Talaromyces proteolyticus]
MAAAEFNKERHIKYFLRCLKTLLPYQYTSGDSGRILLSFFVIAGLDLLGALESRTTAQERQGYINWLYHCQHPSGGFRGFTGTNFGDEKRSLDNEAWDPATLPSTFLALETLLILGDDLSRVKRAECLEWLRKLQRKNGSFGETLGVADEIEGGNDLRFCYCAAGIRYLLRGPHKRDMQDVKDIDVLKLIYFIQSCQAYEGGLAESPFCEAHAGHTYCGIGALSFLKRAGETEEDIGILSLQSDQFNSLLKWLVSRQTTELEEPEESDEEEQPSSEPPDSSTGPILDISNGVSSLPDLVPPNAEALAWAGFSGRCNKLADTCYCFWVTGALDIVERIALVGSSSLRRYLLEKTQHVIGGFGKTVGETPDIYHAYLGMVSLALINEPGLEAADATLCAAARLSQRLEALPWWQARR